MLLCLTSIHVHRPILPLEIKNLAVKVYFLSMRPSVGLFSVLGLSSFVLFVFLLSSQCLCDALVMSQARPQVSTYSLCCLCKDLFQAEGVSKDYKRNRKG